jgi:iron(III) transport system permease protein
MTRWRVAVAAVLVLLIGVPLAMPFVDLIASPGAWRAWAEGGRLLLLARNTLLLVGGTLLFVMPAGVAGAFLLYRSDLPGQRALRFLTVLTLFVPLPLFASGWQAALGSGGWLPVALWNTPLLPDPAPPMVPPSWTPWGQGLVAAVWVHAVAALPWVVLLVGQGLCWVERELEEDALLAAGPWRVFFAVTLRRSLAAVGAAALWVALQTGTEVTVTDTMQVRTFAEEVYTQYVRPEPDDTATTAQAVQARAVAVSIPSVLLTAALIVLAARWWERNLPPLATLSAPPRRFRLGRARWPCLVLVLLLVLVLVGVPVASLVWKAGRAGSPPAWSLGTVWVHVSNNLHAQSDLVLSSLRLALETGAAAAVLALLACWLAVGTRWFQAGVLLLLAAAWALPGPVIGIALSELFVFLSRTTGSEAVERLLRSGPSHAPVFWACLVRFFPCAVALLWPVVRLLPPELRDAARVDGAGPGQEFRHIVWPLTGLAWVRAAWAVAVLSLGELGAGKIVSTPGSTVFAHEIFQRMHYGVTSDLAALCLVLLGVVAVGGALVVASGWLLERVAGERVGRVLSTEY